MEQIGQYKFDVEGHVSCVASEATEHPPDEAQGDLFLYELEQRALEAWYDEPISPQATKGAGAERDIK